MINGKDIRNILDHKGNDNKEIYVKMKNNQKNIYMKPKERMYQYPQVINNYDVNVKVNIKKLNDNNINIENMNITELLGKKLGYNNKRNKSLLKDKKEYFSKTDNNIKFLDSFQTKPSLKKEGIYNNMIADLKNEFKEIKKKHELNKENKNSKKENIRNYLFNENNPYINKESYNNKEKKYIWNNKSENNSYKKNLNKNEITEIINYDLITEKNMTYNENDYNLIKYSEINEVNKNRTQNNFHKIPNEIINFENEKTKIDERIKNVEKLQQENKQNLKNAIIYINNKKAQNSKNKSLNITNDLMNDDNSFINLNEDNDELDLSLKNKFNINKKYSLTNIVKNNNIMKNYISSSNNQKKIINKCNSYISNKKNMLFDNTQKFLNKDIEDVAKINIINKNVPNFIEQKNNNNKENTKARPPKLLYLDKRINKIKNKMINSEYNSNIHQTKIKNNIKIERTIFFSFIKNNNIKNENEKDRFNLNIINKIVKVQNNIILQLKQSQIFLKDELIKKYKEISNFKNICLKLIWFIKENLLKNNINNKKIQTIQNQIINENKILRKLFINKTVNNISINQNNNKKVTNDFKEKKLFHNTFNELKENNNTDSSNCQKRMNTFENNDNDKKRNKSFERFNDKYKANLISINSKNINRNQEPNFKYINFKEKKSKYIGENNDTLNIKPGKKIKYLAKYKNNLSLTFEKIYKDNNLNS